jgi:hypothetical protein
MNITLNREQYKYLKDNGILEQYKANVKSQRTKDNDYSDFYNFINWSFTWSDTPEGDDFWYEHSKKSLDLKSSDLYTLEL